MGRKKNDDWLKPKDHYSKSHVYRCRSQKENQVERLLSDWYGADAPLEIESHQGEPVTLGEVMDGLLAEWNQGDAVTLRTIVEHWHEVIGIAYKPHTRPALLEERVLSIEVFSAPLLVNLRMLEADILEKVRHLVGDEVEKIRLIPGGRSKR